MAASLTFDLPEEQEDENKKTTYVSFDKVYEYLVNHNRLTVSFIKESKSLSEEMESAVELLPDDVREIADKDKDSLYFFLSV